MRVYVYKNSSEWLQNGQRHERKAGGQYFLENTIWGESKWTLARTHLVTQLPGDSTDCFQDSFAISISPTRWDTEIQEGNSESVSSDVTGPFCRLLGHSRRKSMGEWTPGSSFLFRLHLYHLRRVEFCILKALRCWCDTQPLKRCHCQTAVIHLFPRAELGT